MVLSETTAKSWEIIFRAIDKSGGRFILAAALVVCPYQPWLTLNVLLIFSLFTSMLFFLYVGAVSMYYAKDDLITFVEIAHAYSFILAFLILLFNHYAFNLRATQDIFKAIGTGTFEYKTKYCEEEDEKLRGTMKFYHTIFQNGFRVIILLAFILLAILAPFLIIYFGGADRQRIKEINYNLPVPLWMPFDMDTNLGFFCGYFLVMAEVALVGLYLAAAIPFIVFVAFEVNTQYLILMRSILSLEHRALEKYTGYSQMKNPQIDLLRDDPIYVRCLHDSLKENILHHLEILRLFNLYQELTSTLFGVIIGVSMIILASLSIVLTKTDLFSFETFKFAFIFIVELIIVFGYCLMGTFLTNGSQEIPSALYNCPWVNFNEGQRRTMKIFQFNSSISIELRGSGLFLIDLQLFVQIVQTTYSIFNIFSSMES
ncbi:odorant receptor 23a-like isoform X2 [Nilaparvata lugens]|uniref:odorant receptor 23a-like isoform X2 n=1 Tax=Nilaparvata lugens TaxID=108931 RepID=UPI00193DAFC0|nr:odorant receptor 23a-like isoform X2 [Nilaparvata lugens]